MNRIRQIFNKPNKKEIITNYYLRTNRYVRNLGFVNVLFLSAIGLTFAVVLTQDESNEDRPYYRLKLFHRVQPTQTVYQRP